MPTRCPCGARRCTHTLHGRVPTKVPRGMGHFGSHLTTARNKQKKSR